MNLMLQSGNLDSNRVVLGYIIKSDEIKNDERESSHPVGTFMAHLSSSR